MTKYVNNNGVSEIWLNIKNWVTSQLLGKSDVGHTHSASEITDLPSGLTVDTTLDGTSSNAIANSAVSNALDGKSDVGHTHTMSDVTDLEVWNYDSNSNAIIISGGTDTWSYDSQSNSIIVS